jgi:hypothetical protein
LVLTTWQGGRVAFTVALETARPACVDSVQAFLRTAAGFDEYDLFGASRCHGWTRLDVVVHTIAGWQDMLGGLVTLVDTEPTVDAASFWTAFAAEYGGGDQVPALMSQRRRTASYARPASAVEHLGDVGAALLRGVEGLADRGCAWLGHVFTAGDFLAIWAVENAVHQLDLIADEPVPPTALGLARATIEALLEEPLPARSDEDAVLIGTGRLPVPAELDAFSARLPALG